MPVKRVNDEIVKKVLELRKQGLTYREIAEKVGVSIATICRIVKNFENQKQTQQVTSSPSTPGSISSNVPGNVTTSSVPVGVTTIDLNFVISKISEIERRLNDFLKNFENFKTITNSRLEELNVDLQVLRNIIEISKLRIEGSSKCKYIDDYGYCTKLVLPYCPNGCKCIEVINEYGVKMYRVKVIENSLICIACPYYKPRK